MTKQPVVLMYHGVVSNKSPVPPDRETGAELYDVPAKDFATQIEWLHDNGYKAVTIEDAKQNNDGKHIVLTFDDGEMNNYAEALPVLQKYGFVAYFFIIAKRVGKQGYMGWPEIAQMKEAGMVIGSHGLSHEILTNLLDTQMEEELRASKKNLRINLGFEIHDLSIPRGFCNDKILTTAYDLEYKNLFISERPNQLKSVCYSRVAVKSNWKLERFKLAVDVRVPRREAINDFIKKSAKFVLRESGYNKLRGMLIKFSNF